MAVRTPARPQKKRAVSSVSRVFLSHVNLSQRAGRLFRGRAGASLVDQAVISGSNLFASIVLVRGLGLHEFGKYAIAYALLLYANSSQMSFITSPMLTIAPLMDGKEKRQFVDGMYSIQLLASVLLCAAFAVIGGVSRQFTSFYSVPSILAFAVCVGTFQLQDWVRRYYFLYNKFPLAILSDFTSYFVQLILLLLLWRFGQLTLVRTFLVMGITSAAGFAVGLISERIRPRASLLKSAWKRSRGLSRDLLIASQVQWFGSQGVLLIGTGIVGAAAAGGLRATLNLSGPVNLVLSSLENVIPIRISEELKSRGTAGAYVFVRRVMLYATSLFALLLVPVALFGRPILRLLYGPVMVAFYFPMLLQLLTIVVRTIAIESFYFFRGLHDTRALLRANAFSAIASVSSIYFLGRVWNASGIVISSLLGQLVVVAYFALHWSRHKDDLLLRYPSGTSKDFQNHAVSRVERVQAELRWD
jgi:O-antigen/teichoic acid export membrane protein